MASFAFFWDFVSDYKQKNKLCPIMPKKKSKTNIVFSDNILLLCLKEQGHGSDLFHLGDQMGYRQIYTDDACVLAKRC